MKNYSIFSIGRLLLFSTVLTSVAALALSLTAFISFTVAVFCSGIFCGEILRKIAYAAKPTSNTAPAPK